MVRAGQGAYLIDEFTEKDVVALGWNDIGEITAGTTLEDIKRMLLEAYPDSTDGYIRMSAGQIWRFFHDFEIGDTVVTYDPDARAYYMGSIISDYQYDESYSHHHIRKVEWEEGPHYRDELSVASKNTLGAIMTIFEVPEDVKKDLEMAHPGYISEEDQEAIDEMIEHQEQFQKEEEDRIREEIVSKSNEFIKDQVVQLSWSEMEALTAGIFRAMGYKTRMTSKGSDLGSDIHVSPDGLGMIEPRIKVEVKHKVKSKEKVGSDLLRNFIGGLRTEKGIYVSTTGFSKDAQYEAERANFTITLIDADLFVELLLENYEGLEPEIKALVPLKKIYWPV